VGNVGSLGLGRIERHLGATEVGKLARPGRYYDFTRYRPRSIRNKGVREYIIPNTIIRTAIREDAPDLVFMHLMEPHNYGEDYTDSVLELLTTLGVKRYSLVGAMYDMVPHTRPLLVSGGSRHPSSEEEYRSVKVSPSDYQGPTSITYLINQQAESLGIETRTFVVHLPQYFQVDEDFTGTARLMEILCTLYHLPNRLRIPGLTWAQRYINLEESEGGATRFTALYRIRHASDFPSILDRNGSPDFHPIAASEFAAFSQLDGMSGHVANVYEQINGTPLRPPLLESDRPISIVTAGVDPEHETE